MQASSLDFDIPAFKSIMTMDPTKENGWGLEYEGKVNKDFKDSTIKVYKKQDGNTAGFTIRVDAVLKGINIDNFVLMQRDIAYREKFATPPKQIKMIERTSSNTDTIYLEVNLPFPMTNRDFVQKRLFVNNKEDPELVRKLGLFDWSHKYSAILVQSTEREEYPEKSKPIRGDTKMHHMLLEEDPNDKSVLKVKMVMSQAMKGDIPQIIMNTVAKKMPKMMMGGFMASYQNFFGN